MQPWRPLVARNEDSQHKCPLQNRFFEGWPGLASAGLAWPGLAGAPWNLEMDVREAVESRNGAVGRPGLAWRAPSGPGSSRCSKEINFWILKMDRQMDPKMDPRNDPKNDPQMELKRDRA